MHRQPGQNIPHIKTIIACGVKDWSPHGCPCPLKIILSKITTWGFMQSQNQIFGLEADCMPGLDQNKKCRGGTTGGFRAHVKNLILTLWNFSKKKRKIAGGPLPTLSAGSALGKVLRSAPEVVSERWRVLFCLYYLIGHLVDTLFLTFHRTVHN